MNKRLWTFRFKRDIEQKGDERAPWYVGWYDSDGKRHAENCGAGEQGRRKAEKRKRRIQSELDTGLHNPSGRTRWAKFREEYEAKILSGLAHRSRPEVKTALDHFERIVKPGRMEAIRPQTIDAFISKRREERGKKRESSISPATINKDLRHIKAALRVAHEWGYLPTVPKFRMEREPGKLPRFVTPEHFATIYQKACPLATFPRNPEQHYTACEWWKALAVTAYMTGLRISEVLALKREDVDLEAGTLITRAEDNKGNRTERLPLNPVVVEHLRPIIGFHPIVFRWSHGEAELWEEFGRIQREAGIKLTCRGEHEHTDACHVYGFHDFRRAFATVNAPRMKPEALQKLMRHKSYLTTLRYINLASQLDEAVASMPVPAVLQVSVG